MARKAAWPDLISFLKSTVQNCLPVSWFAHIFNQSMNYLTVTVYFLWKLSVWGEKKSLIRHKALVSVHKQQWSVCHICQWHHTVGTQTVSTIDGATDKRCDCEKAMVIWIAVTAHQTESWQHRRAVKTKFSPATQTGSFYVYYSTLSGSKQVF